MVDKQEKHKKKHASKSDDDTINMIVLGSGTGLPSLTRSAPGYFVEAGGKQMLVDCGSGTLVQLLRAERDYRALDAVFFTHLHVDHFGDLLPLLHVLRFPGNTRENPLYLFGPPGFEAFFNTIIRPVVGEPRFCPLVVQEVLPVQEWDDMTIFTTAITHVEHLNSVAYRFEWAGKSLVFTGDCDVDPRLPPFAREADMMVMDCSSLAAGKMVGHLSAAECGQIAAESNVKRVLLTHLYPIGAPDSMRVSECRKHFSGTVRLAEDGMRFGL